MSFVDRNAIEPTVRDMLPGVGVCKNADSITSLTDLGANSSDIVKFMLDLERTFGIEFSESDMTPANFRNIDSISRTISNYI